MTAKERKKVTRDILKNCRNIITIMEEHPEVCDGHILSIAIDPVDKYVSIMQVAEMTEDGHIAKYHFNYAEFGKEEV